MRVISLILALMSFITLAMLVYYELVEYVFTGLLCLGCIVALYFLWDAMLTHFSKEEQK